VQCQIPGLWRKPGGKQRGKKEKAVGRREIRVGRLKRESEVASGTSLMGEEGEGEKKA